MDLEERPDVEVLDAVPLGAWNTVFSIHEVQGGTLAECNSEQAVSVETPCLWMSAKEGIQISECDVAQ
jgi:hypothetical protein